MNPRPPTPPQLADRLLAWFCAPHLLETLQGDLHEEFAYQVERIGQRRARWRYWRDVLGFVRPYVLKRNETEYTQPFFLSPEMIRNYLKIALRNLTKHKVSTLINLAGLTLGVTACLVIYLITRFELSYDTFHPDRDRIYRIAGQSKFGKNDEFRPLGFIPRAAPKAIRAEVPGLETVATFHNIETDVIIPNGREEARTIERRTMGTDPAQIVITEPEYFSIFQYEWLAGNPRTALNEPYQVVLSEDRAHLYFGDIPPDQMLGRELIYRDSIRTHVTGIVKGWHQNTDFSFTDFISFATIRASRLKQEINLDEWNDVWSSSQAFVKLSRGTTPAQVNDRLAVFSQKHFGPNRGTGDFRFIPSLQPLSDLHFNTDYQDNYSRQAHLPTLYGLMGVAVFILLIAAINFINLATARSVHRAQEVGMRKVLGSSRTILLAQFMSETFILTTLAVGVALLITQPVLLAFQSFIPKGVALSVFNPQLLLFLLALTLMTALLSGLYPAWAMSAYQPALTLKGQTALVGNQKGYLRKGLIVFQFTISLVFIVATLMVGRQLNFIRNKDLGFSTDAIVLINTLHDDKSQVLAQKIRQLSGVDGVTMQWFAPMGENYMLTKLTYQGATEIETEVSAKVGDVNFIPLYHIRLVAGRNFLPSDTLSELVINQTYARTLGFKQPAEAIGKLLKFNGRSYPIVGVVADFHENSLHARIKPAFIAYLPNMSRNLGVKLATKGQQVSDATLTLDAIEAAWQEVYPNEKFEFSFLDDSIAKIYEKEQKTSLLVNTATAIAILISCMGLFGLATFAAEQRTKEIGIRKVLGASVTSIVALLSAEFVRLVLIAVVIASPIAWYAVNQWLQDFAYKVNLDWWVFVLAGALAVGIALLTVSVQSVKAALTNPARSLRTE
ncbi:FtsX-like permease family protein [Spirosoma taeanense]|uniref:FtsX-like permease family protein n=1 Tax=Spirosoma taeanense TaxID=2735870 RepID=A0A6M5Y8I4_9BACT|nr:ABC transporter permease [Spirosoma taeanense]QJW89676.1 FtsX-like permease family protein [Spirosoma taeanense]